MPHLESYNIIISKLMVYLIDDYNNSQYFLVSMICWFAVGRALISCILARKCRRLGARGIERKNTLVR